jgi:transposase InsO family protein
VDFTQVAARAGITVLKTPSAAPNANAVVERFQGSVRGECLITRLSWGSGICIV